MYSVDTNLVIGLLNPEDRLNKASMSFIRHKGTGELLLLKAVIDETKSTFLKNYGEALATIQHLSKEGDFKEKIVNLISLEHRLTNFYRLILKQLNENYSEIEFMKLRSDAVEAINSFASQLETKIGRFKMNFPISLKQNEKQKELLSNCNNLAFSDSKDKEIFIELAYGHLSEELRNLNEFYSNDKAFISQSRRAAKQCKIEKICFFALKQNSESPYYEIESEKQGTCAV